jgi:hypothetical protein
MTDRHFAAEVAHVVKQARAAGLSSIDLWTLEDLLHEHHVRRDLVDKRADMLLVPLT